MNPLQSAALALRSAEAAAGAEMTHLMVTAKAGVFRRAGFRFGAEPIILDLEELGNRALAKLLTEPMLIVTASHNLVDWISLGANVLAARFPAAAPITRAAESVIVPAIAEAAATGHIDLPGDLRRLETAAAGAIVGAIPGIGAGADHPASGADVIVQRTIDPNPPLPAAGATADNAVIGMAEAAAPVIVTDAAEVAVGGATGELLAGVGREALAAAEAAAETAASDSAPAKTTRSRS